MEIDVIDYSKTIRNRVILDRLNLHFQSGRCYGLHGRNGSGKTMLLRALCGLIFPSSGQIKIDGKVLHEDIDFPESVGIIIEKTELLSAYTGKRNLQLLSKIKNVASEADIVRTLESVGLDPHDKRKVRAYSLGMKQKLSLAQAIFEQPELLLLDEPTNALDEESVDKLRDVLIELKNDNKLIIVASHNKDDLSILCDELVYIDNGHIEQYEWKA